MLTTSVTGTDAVADAVLLGAAVLWTGRADGDLADPGGGGPEVERRRRAVVDLPWTVLRQVHSAGVVVVERPGERRGEEGDALVTRAGGAVLAVLTADCAPVALASPEGVLGVAHAGWRGLAAGVVLETVAAMRRLGATTVHAALGPCVRPDCYAFGQADLDRLAARLGDEVRATTAGGEPALDLPAGVRAELRRAGAELVADSGVCTACSAHHWSWRARAEVERQATTIWRR